MKILLMMALALGSLINCKNRVTGNSDEVNSGVIAGNLITDGGNLIEDTVTVSLFADYAAEGLTKIAADTQNAFVTLESTDGTFQFDSLGPGIYHINVIKDSIVIGGEKNIKLERINNKPQKIEINIQVVIIINQTFNIWTDESQHLTVNNFYMENGTIEPSENGYVLTTAEADTLVFEAEVEQEGKSSVIKVRIIRNEDGTRTFDILETAEDVNVVITSDIDSPEGFLGTLTINVGNPGRTKVESTFDTSGVPVKSK